MRRVLAIETGVSRIENPWTFDVGSEIVTISQEAPHTSQVPLGSWQPRAHLTEVGLSSGPWVLGGSFRPSSYRRSHFRRACEAAGLKAGNVREARKRTQETDAEGLSPKDLRDTYGSWLITAGVQLAYVSDQLGHADTAVTAKHYAQWTQADAYREPLTVHPGRSAGGSPGSTPQATSLRR